MKKIFGLVAALSFVAAANATLTHQLVSVANGGALPANTFTYDLKVVVSGQDDWTSSATTAQLSGGKTFYQNSFGGNTTPNPAFFPLAPELQWDTFATQPGSYPNSNDGTSPGTFGTTTVDGDTFNIGVLDTANTGDGTFTIARYSIVSPPNRPGLTLANTGLVVGTLSGTTTAKNSGGTLIPYSFNIYQVPEPATLSLLVLGGLAGLLRRR